MTLKLITAPASEPLTLAEAKAQCEVVDSDWDTWFTTAIIVAREMAEHETGRALVTQTWERTLDGFVNADGAALDAIPLLPPVQSMVQLVYVDTAGAPANLTETTDYVLDNVRDPGFVVPAYGKAWPDTYATINAVKVRFVTGYGNAAAVPAAIKHWMLMQIGAMFANRESVVMQTGTSPGELPNRFVERLLDRYRVVS